jgi:hypothetical protein
VDAMPIKLNTTQSAVARPFIKSASKSICI